MTKSVYYKLHIDFDVPRSVGKAGDAGMCLEGHSKGKSIKVIYTDWLPFNLSLWRARKKIINTFRAIQPYDEEYYYGDEDGT